MSDDDDSVGARIAYAPADDLEALASLAEQVIAAVIGGDADAAILSWDGGGLVARAMNAADPATDRPSRSTVTPEREDLSTDG